MGAFTLHGTRKHWDGEGKLMRIIQYSRIVVLGVIQETLRGEQVERAALDLVDGVVLPLLRLLAADVEPLHEVDRAGGDLDPEVAEGEDDRAEGDGDGALEADPAEGLLDEVVAVEVARVGAGDLHGAEVLREQGVVDLADVVPGEKTFSEFIRHAITKL